MAPLMLLALLLAPGRAQPAPASPFTAATEWAREAVGRELCASGSAADDEAHANLAALASAGNGVLPDERRAIPGLLQDAADAEKGFRGDESARDFRGRVRSVVDRLGLTRYEDNAAVVERCLRTACAAAPGGPRCTRGGVPVPPPEPAPPSDARTLSDARARGAAMTARVSGFGGVTEAGAVSGGKKIGGSAASGAPTGGGAVSGAPSPAPTTPPNAAAVASAGGVDYAALNRQARLAPALSRLKRPIDVPAPGAPAPTPVPLPLPPAAAAAGPAAGAGVSVKPAFARSSEDEIALMRKTFDATVARLVKEGKRTPGNWTGAAIWNDLRSAHGGANLLCYDQAHELLHDLAKAFGSSYDSSVAKDQLYFYDSTGKWRFVFTTYTGEGHEADGHYWVTAISRVPADDTVIMDPWVGKFERTREKNPIAIKGFLPYWYGRAAAALRGP